jgi:hypothetical protein
VWLVCGPAPTPSSPNVHAVCTTSQSGSDETDANVSDAPAAPEAGTVAASIDGGRR